MRCCKAQSNLAGQARDRLCQKQQQLFTRSDPPPQTETCPSRLSKGSVMLAPAGPSSELWAVAWLQRLMVPARMVHGVGHPCDGAALVTSPEGCYSRVPLAMRTPRYTSAMVSGVISRQTVPWFALPVGCGSPRSARSCHAQLLARVRP